MQKGIGKKIKENMTYQNFTHKDMATLLSISEKHLSEILSNKQKISAEISIKLDRIFGFELGTILRMQENNRINNLTHHKDLKEMANVIEKYPKFELIASGSLLFQLAKLFYADYQDYQNYLDGRVIDFNQYKEKPMAILWFAIMEKKYGFKRAIGKFNASNGKSVINQSLFIMFNKEPIEKRIETLKVMLDKNGIVLATEPFIKDSTMTGASTVLIGKYFKKSKQRFIFLNDYNKREYSFIFSLIHELFHLYRMMEDEDNNLVTDFIKKYMSKNNIEHEISYAFDILENKELSSNEKSNLLHKNTKMRLSFGEPAKLLEEMLLRS